MKKYSFKNFFTITNENKLTDTFLEIKKEQDESEVLISWIQLSFAILIFVSWVTSIIFRASKPEYEVVPLMLVPYILFSIAKISWARKRLLNDAVLSMSIIIDVSLVTGLIWLFHVQYHQLPGFYLKVPTFVYYFFFISLRSLRYDTKYVLLSGLFSILSWSGLVYYAIQHKDSVISSSFVEYTESHGILLGAEIEKILGIVFVTLVSTVAVYRKQSLLKKSVEDSKARKNLTNFFSEEVAEAINKNKEALKPGYGTTRYAAVLMVDLRGFTKMTQGWAPQDILKLISEYQNIVVPIILQNNGCIDKYMGDGIFAHFGAANNSATFAKDALKSMEEIEHAILEWDKKRSNEGRDAIKIGQAMAVGNVVFGTTGEKSRLEFTTIGSTVNLVAKLEKHTKDLKVSSLTTLRAFQMGKDQGFVPSLEVSFANKNYIESIKGEIDLVIIEPPPRAVSLDKAS